MIVKYSEILKQGITLDTRTGTATAEDGTVYSKDELNLLYGCSDEMKIKIHKVKKVFQGVIID